MEKPAVPMILLFLFAAANLQAQTSGKLITEAEAIEIGLANNLQLQVRDLAIQKSGLWVNASQNLPKTGFFIENEDANRDDKNGILKIGVAQNFEYPTVYRARKTLATESQKRSVLEKSMTAAELKKAIRMAYFQLWYWQENLKLLSQLDSVYLQLFNAAEVQRKAGEVNGLAVIAADARVQEIRLQIRQSEKEATVEQQELSKLLNSGESYFAENRTLPKIETVPVADFSANPILQFQQQNIGIANAELDLQKQSMKPDFTSRFFHQGLYGIKSPFYGYSLTVGVPLFRSISKSKMAVARTEIALQQKQLEQQTQAISVAAGQQQTELEKDRAALTFYETTGLKQAEAIITAATQSYRAGEISFAELTQYLTQAIDTKIQYLEVLNRFNQSAIQLQFLNNQ